VCVRRENKSKKNYVCACECVRERVCLRTSVLKGDRDREKVHVCVFVCERATENVCVLLCVCERVCMRERERVCFQSSVLKGERDRERVRVCARKKKNK